MNLGLHDIVNSHSPQNKALSTLLFVLCGTFCAFSMVVICTVLSVVLMRQMQKKKQTLPSSHNLSAEVVNTGHVYVTVASNTSADECKDGVVNSHAQYGNADPDQHGVFSPENKMVVKDVEVTATTENYYLKDINSQDLSNVDLNDLNIFSQHSHSSSGGSADSARISLQEDSVHPQIISSF